MLNKMLCFDPSDRITVRQALEHPWLSSYHDPDDEPDCPVKFEKWREIERLETMEEFREALWNEIEEYRSEVRGLNLNIDFVVREYTEDALPDGMRPGGIRQRAASQSSAILEEAALRESPVIHAEPPKMPDHEELSAIAEDEVSEPLQTAEPEEIQEPPASQSEDELEIGKTREATDVLPDIMPSLSPEISHRRSVTTPTDPVVTYARRSSILQPSRQGSTYNSPVPGAFVSAFIEGSSTAEKPPQGGIPFPTQGYVVPARSRTGSTVGGEIPRRLLRTLSTVSIHESAEGHAGGLAGIAPIGKFITEVNTEADAPPSEVPKDFGISSDVEGEEETAKGGKKPARFTVP